MDASTLGRKLGQLPPFAQNLVWNGLVAFSASPLGLILGQMIELTRRLRGPHPRAAPKALRGHELDDVSYADIDMLDGIPKDPTHEGYAVIGGSGYVGCYIVRLLLLRGETSIRVIDLAPPPADLAVHPAVEFAQADITAPAALAEALARPFAASAAPPRVVFHTAALIRFWERRAYTQAVSQRVNVEGTANVLCAARALPEPPIVVYTSSSDVVLPRPRFMQLGKDYETPPWDRVVFGDGDAPLIEVQAPDGCYARSKMQAEELVRRAHGEGGLKTGVLRPGQSIIGPNDRLLTSTLTRPRVTVFDRLWSHTNICVWDAAAAHLCLEDALRHGSADVGGEAFLITGNGPAWAMQDYRDAVQHYSSRTLAFEEVHPLLIYVLAHFIEVFLFLRYYVLLLPYALFGSAPSLAPAWMGEVIYLQPTTLTYMRDVVIDDSRARKLIGYRPQWQTAQAIRYTVDELESGKAKAVDGLQLKRQE